MLSPASPSPFNTLYRCRVLNAKSSPSSEDTNSFNFSSVHCTVSVSFYQFVYFGFAFHFGGFLQTSGDLWLSAHIYYQSTKLRLKLLVQRQTLGFSAAYHMGSHKKQLPHFFREAKENLIKVEREERNKE